MTINYLTRVLLTTVFGMLLVTGCGRDAVDYEYHKSSQELDETTPLFTPTYFKDTERRHMAVFFDISDGVLALSDRPAEIRPGNMPYHTATGGNVLIVYKNADGKELGRYAIEDPVLARSCDFDDGNTGELRSIPKGMTEILLPFDGNIATIELGRIDRKPKTFDVGNQVTALREKGDGVN